MESSTFGISSLSPEMVGLIANVMTPVTVIMGMFFITYLVRLSLREYRYTSMRNIEALSSEKPSIINIDNSETREQIGNRGGFAFFDVEEDKKTIFVDIMAGFKDFAKLKGYDVNIDLDTSTPGKVAVRITIEGMGVVFGIAKVRKDVDEYIEKLNHSSDLDNMPMIVDPVEHHRLVSTLKARFAFARVEVEMHEAASNFYKGLLESVKAFSHLGLEHRLVPPPMHFHVTAEGGRAMGDNYTATNSPAAAVGKKNKVRVKDSNFNIGSTQIEKNERVESLNDLISALKSSDIKEDDKNKAVRNLENVKEEIQESKEPDESQIWKWLERAGTIIEGATAGSELLEKARSTMSLFGISA